MTEAQLAEAVAKAIIESDAQFTAQDLLAIFGGILFLAILAFRYIYIPYKQGLTKSVSPDDLIPRAQAEKAITVISDIYNEVKQGNAVILQKDGDGQVSLLNIPRWLRDMVSSQQRTEGHIQNMVNHQSDVLIAIAETVQNSSKSMDSAAASLASAVTILRQVRNETAPDSDNTAS